MPHIQSPIPKQLGVAEFSGKKKMFLTKALRRLLTIPGQVPLRAILVVPFILQIFSVVGLTGWLSVRNGQQAVNEVTLQLRNEISDRIAQRLENYLEAPRIIAQINTDSIQLGELNVEDTGSLTRQFWRQRFLFKSANVSAIYFGSEEGEFIGLGFQEDNTWQVGRKGVSTNGKFYSFATDDKGNPTTLLEKGGDYDPRIRPWYQRAVAAREATWSDVYADFKELRLKVTLVQPVYREEGELLGVVGVDFVLSHINDFLETLKIGKTGQTYIMDASGLLIASSTPEKPFVVEGENVERAKAENASDSLIRESAEYLKEYFGEFDFVNGKDILQLEFCLNGKRQFVQAMPFADGENLDWLIVVVVPEADFMERIEANTRTTILLCLAALLVASVLGVVTARWIARPIWRLSLASKSLAERMRDRDFTNSRLYEKVEAKGVDELGVLAESFNLMAQQLQESFKALENTNAELEVRVEQRTAALRRSEEKFYMAFQASPNSITISTIADGRFIEVNDSFIKITGYSREEAIAKNAVELNLWANPEQQRNLIKLLQEQGRVRQQEIEFRLKSGEVRTGLWSAETIDLDGEPCLLSLISDITERKQAAQALRFAEEKYRSIFENAAEGIFQTKPNGGYLSANPALARMYGYDSAEELIKNVVNIDKKLYVSKKRRNEFLTAIHKHGEISNFESQVYRRDRSIIWVSENARIVRDADREVLYYEGTVEDITLRKLAEEALRAEQEKSERLLLNILPPTIAEELKENTHAIADYFEDATILFSDIVGFTPLSAAMSPIELVSLLNQMFSTFDQLAEKHGLEKIKTIGDAYMVAGGLPVPKDDRAEAIAQMALDMQEAIATFELPGDFCPNPIDNCKGKNQCFQIRIGIHTGPVVAGVIGIKKFIYDLWGDTVNVASRMESSGEPGKIHVTAAFYERLKDKFMFEQRGAIDVKGKGKMMTYWLTGIKDW